MRTNSNANPPPPGPAKTFAERVKHGIHIDPPEGGPRIASASLLGEVNDTADASTTSEKESGSRQLLQSQIMSMDEMEDLGLFLDPAEKAQKAREVDFRRRRYEPPLHKAPPYKPNRRRWHMPTWTENDKYVKEREAFVRDTLQLGKKQCDPPVGPKVLTGLVCCTSIKTPTKDWIIATKENGRMQMYVNGVGMQPGAFVDAAVVGKLAGAKQGTVGHFAIAAETMQNEHLAKFKGSVQDTSVKEVASKKQVQMENIQASAQPEELIELSEDENANMLLGDTVQDGATFVPSASQTDEDAPAEGKVLVKGKKTAMEIAAGTVQQPDYSVTEFLRRRRSIPSIGRWPETEKVRYGVKTFNREERKMGCLVSTAYGRRKIETTLPYKVPMRGFYTIKPAKLSCRRSSRPRPACSLLSGRTRWGSATRTRGVARSAAMERMRRAPPSSAASGAASPPRSRSTCARSRASATASRTFGAA